MAAGGTASSGRTRRSPCADRRNGTSAGRVEYPGSERGVVFREPQGERGSVSAKFGAKLAGQSSHITRLDGYPRRRRNLQQRVGHSAIRGITSRAADHYLIYPAA